MSRGRPGAQESESEDGSSRGLNLSLLYTILGIALLVALGIAAMIILPFYQHRH
jgi:hypothetical protein